MKQETTNNQIVTKKVVDGIRQRNVILRIPNVEYRTKVKSNVLYFGLKLIGLSVLTVILSIGFGRVGSTVSYFNDMEKALGNFMKTDPLSFKVEIASSTSIQIDLTQGKTVVTPIMTPVDESESIQYFVKSSISSGDGDLCNNVRMTGTWPFPFDSNISTLVTGTTTKAGAWTLEFSVLDYALYSNKTCTIDLVYEGWNAGSAYGIGYKDTQKVSLTFSVPKQLVSAPAFTAETNEKIDTDISEPEIVEEEVVEILIDESKEVPIDTKIQEEIVDTTVQETVLVPTIIEQEENQVL